MAEALLTMPVMAKRKPGRPKGRKPTYALYVRIRPSLGAAFDELLKRTRRTATAEVELMLEKFLADAGLWDAGTDRPIIPGQGPAPRS